MVIKSVCPKMLSTQGVKPKKARQQMNEAETQTDFPENLMTLTMPLLFEIIEKKVTTLLAEKMQGLDDKTTILQTTIVAQLP